VRSAPIRVARVHVQVDDDFVHGISCYKVTVTSPAPLCFGVLRKSDCHLNSSFDDLPFPQL
jgi:hypothetical protein